jgi:hypothetical protein
MKKLTMKLAAVAALVGFVAVGMAVAALLHTGPIGVAVVAFAGWVAAQTVVLPILECE